MPVPHPPRPLATTPLTYHYRHCLLLALKIANCHAHPLIDLLPSIQAVAPTIYADMTQLRVQANGLDGHEVEQQTWERAIADLLRIGKHRQPDHDARAALAICLLLDQVPRALIGESILDLLDTDCVKCITFDHLAVVSSHLPGYPPTSTRDERLIRCDRDRRFVNGMLVMAAQNNRTARQLQLELNRLDRESEANAMRKILALD